MPEHHTNDSASLFSPIAETNLLRTVSAIEGAGGAISEKQSRERGRMLQVRDQVAELAAVNGLKVSESISKSLFPTPNTMDHLPARDESKIDRSKGGFANVRETVMRMNLPTPTVADTFTDNLKSSQQKEGSMHSVNLSQAVHMDWGRFQPAILRWEVVTQNAAPTPTKPDGQDGNHRLSSEFTEWMMGLPPGWVSGVGLSRKDELKACGNGVVPQQAELALRVLLARFALE